MSVDWTSYGWSPELLARVQAAPKPARIKRSTQPFTKLPDIWWNRLGDIDAKGCTYQVARRLFHRAWRTNSQSVLLANQALQEMGITRKQKWIALRELEAAGLVAVQRRTRRSPIVRLLHCS
jgi:hypothetical protein